MSEPEYVAVIAGNIRQFHDWAREQVREHEVAKLYPSRSQLEMNGKRYFNVGRPEDLLGMRVAGHVSVGTWYERNDLGEIEREMRHALVRTR